MLIPGAANMGYGAVIMVRILQGLVEVSFPFLSPYVEANYCKWKDTPRWNDSHRLKQSIDW